MDTSWLTLWMKRLTNHVWWGVGVLIALTVGMWFAFSGIFHEADSLGYAYNIREGSGLFHPHHLLPMVVIRWLWETVGFGDVIRVAQVHNLIHWVAVVLLMYALTLRLLGRVSWALLAGLSLILAFDFIRYSLWVEVYVPATAWMLGAMYVLSLKQPLSVLHLVGVAVCWAMAVLYHQTHVLWAIPLMVYSVRTRQILSGGMILVMSGALVLGCYVYAVFIHSGSITWENFQQFVFAYAYAPYDNWGSFQNLKLEGWVSLFNSQTDVFLHKGSDIFSLITLAVLGWNGYQLRKYHPGAEWRLFLWVLVLVYYAFNAWWLPGEEEFFISTAPILALLFWMMMADIRWKYVKNIPRRLGLIVGGVLIVGIFLLGNLPFLREMLDKTDPQYEQAVWVNQVASNGCRIVVGHSDTWANLQYYFNRRELIGMDYIQAHFYGAPQPDFPSVNDSPCLFTDLEHLQPGFEAIPGTVALTPEGHQSFLKWLFDVKENPEGEGWVGRRYEARTEHGKQGIEILSEYVPIEDFAYWKRELLGGN